MCTFYRVNTYNYLQVKTSTEEFSSKSNKNLGSMDNQVEGLTNRWMETLTTNIIIPWIRMTEVDENLNYMLGQLSLVVTEFNQVVNLEPTRKSDLSHLG